MGSAPTSRLPAAERRRQLLDVSVKLFAEQGFDGTSMADLAEAAGVTKPVLYQHFRSKRALYSELLEEVSHLLLSEVEKAAAAAVGPHAQVRAGFAAYFRFVDQRRSAFQLLFLGGSRHDRELTVAVDRLEAAMAEAIAPLIEAGIGPKQRRQLAMALVGMAEATGRRALIDPDLVDPDGLEAMAGRLAELAWAGLRGIRPEDSAVRAAVLTATEGPVRVVTINRPEVRNAVDGPTASLLAEALRAADSDDGISVMVLTGSEGTFCAGADLKAVATGRGNRVTREGDGPMGPTRLVMSKPVIAAVEGHAVAGGLELALWCDLRVAAEDAVFGVYCRRWGVPLIDGGTVRLPRLIGHSRAMDMILTGRPVSGHEALEFGLANRLVVPGSALEAAVSLGTQLAGFPQACLRSDRDSALRQWGRAEDEAMAYEVEVGLATIASGETQAGAARFASGAGRHGAFDQ